MIGGVLALGLGTEEGDLGMGLLMFYCFLG